MAVIVVTGATGILGMHLIPLLVRRGHQVVSVSRAPRNAAPAAVQAAGCSWVTANWANPAELFPLLPDHCDALFHLAWPSVPRSSLTRRDFELTHSVQPTCQLIDAWQRKHRGPFLFASSIAAYGTACHGTPASEATPPEPVSAYGWAKLQVEEELKRQEAENDLHYLILRYAPMFGPWPRLSGTTSVINNFLAHLAAGTPAMLSAPPITTREYLFAPDAALFTNDLLNMAPKGSTINVGSGEAISLSHLIRLIERRTGKALLYGQTASSGVDPEYLVMDESLLSRLTGRVPTTLEHGIKLTWEWLRETGGHPDRT